MLYTNTNLKSMDQLISVHSKNSKIENCVVYKFCFIFTKVQIIAKKLSKFVIKSFNEG